MKKVAQPVVCDKPFRIGWPGYRDSSHFGELFVMRWPDDHPDSHCENGAYDPDETGECRSCSWIPVDAVCCSDCGTLLRYKAEKALLEEMVSEAPFTPMRVLYAAYIAYCMYFADELQGTPALAAVKEWFNSEDLNDEQRRTAVESYAPSKMDMVLIPLGRSGSGFPGLDEMFDLIKRF